jgi:hypothetical protein
VIAAAEECLEFEIMLAPRETVEQGYRMSTRAKVTRKIEADEASSTCD